MCVEQQRSEQRGQHEPDTGRGVSAKEKCRHAVEHSERPERPIRASALIHELFKQTS